MIAAAALRCLGGDFQGILKFRNEEEKKRAQKMGIADFDRVYDISSWLVVTLCLLRQE